MTVSVFLLLWLLAALHLSADNHWEIRALQRFVGPKVGQGRRFERWEFHFMEKEIGRCNALRIGAANDRASSRETTTACLVPSNWVIFARSRCCRQRASLWRADYMPRSLLLSMLEFPLECCNTQRLVNGISSIASGISLHRCTHISRLTFRIFIDESLSSAFAEIFHIGNQLKEHSAASIRVL